MKTGMTSIRKKSWLLNITRWFDSYAGNDAPMTSTQFNWVRVIPFLILHLACFAAFWTGVSTVALVTCLGLFWLRMFAITAFYHRYFAHRSYKTNRFWQFIFALVPITFMWGLELTRIALGGSGMSVFVLLTWAFIIVFIYT